MEINLKDKKTIESIVYYGMAYCFNDACPKAERCFRHIAAQFKDATVKSGNAIYPDALHDGKCDYFIRPRIINAAWGFNGLYHNVRQQDVATLRSQITSLLGGKTSYYRIFRGEKLLTPEKQQEIARLFKAYGYPTPRFDHYKETVDLTEKDV